MMNTTLKKIDSFVVNHTDIHVNLIVACVLISVGMIMLVDHRGLDESDVLFVNTLGSIFLIGGIMIFSLCCLSYYYLRQQSSKSGSGKQ